jgi:hypothetical protein
MTIDGDAASIEDIRALLVVHRVGGDEGLVELFARQAEAMGETVRRWWRRNADVESGTLASLESVVSNASNALGDTTADRLKELEKEVAAAEADHQDAAAEQEAAVQRLRDVAALHETLQALAEARERLPHLRQQAQDLDATIHHRRHERDEIQERILLLAGRVGGNATALKELKNARRTLERNRDHLILSLQQASTIAAELGIDAASEAVDELLVRFRGEVAQLEQERTALDAAPVMRQLLDQLTLELSGAEQQGLADQVAIEDPETDIQLTVAQTKAGMGVRRQSLEGQPPPPEARRVADELVALAGRVRRAEELRGILAEAQRRTRLVGQNEERVGHAVEAANPSELVELQELESRRRGIDDVLLALASERAAVRQQLGVLGEDAAPEVLERELRESAERLQVRLDDLPNELALAEEAASRAQSRLQTSAEQRAAARRELARAAAEIRRSVVDLATHDEWSWLRDALSPGVLPTPDLPLDQQALALDVARDRLKATAERLGRFRIQALGVGSALSEVARHLRSQTPEAVEYVPELQQWFGRRFADWFNTKGVRAELLPEADGSIEVDLVERNARWSSRGLPRWRPLEAFSSGEQAFAYTRARLAVLDEQTPRPANRLIVLDEFGAFIAHDRLAALLSYIRDRADDHPEDQVLVILPLSRSYEAMAEGAFGPERDRLQKLATEISARKFAVQVIAK